MPANIAPPLDASCPRYYTINVQRKSTELPELRFSGSRSTISVVYRDKSSKRFSNCKWTTKVYKGNIPVARVPPPIPHLILIHGSSDQTVHTVTRIKCKIFIFHLLSIRLFTILHTEHFIIFLLMLALNSHVFMNSISYKKVSFSMCIYIYMCVCMCVCTYVYIYTYICMH